ncbi:DUF4227 family protein [Pullulanibacillus sp. KACC 23026]|uniref:DUF4227 family protein n=1 Tax=Pullulanibacillus sp. KACC 23026 TaxID=3028315 RepID=UPI0023AFAA99|nr:DUF4227 family protein [Pullulanibacillus sp. KACC 23026]WEG11451.1 DUF4227 family protein [Pullulanibacillus sp. KACC 23026]
MRKSFRTFLDSLKLFVLFITCTVMFYFGLKWLDQHYASSHKYDEPGDGAVKVVGQIPAQSQPTAARLSNRLFQFLRDGE